MNWTPVVAVLVAWTVAALVLLLIRDKRLSKQFCVLVLVVSSLSAGCVQYYVLMRFRHAERLSAARLVAVSGLRIDEDAEFVRKQLLAPFAAENGGQLDATTLDWGDTFQMKAEDIAATISSVERNSFLRANYSVWMGEVEFQRDQLERLAKRIRNTDDAAPRMVTVKSYVEGVELAAAQLQRFAREIRSRPPEASYE